MKTTTQRRAAAGGEFGVNGEWYDGGKFIATQENTIKAAPMRHEMTAEEVASRAAINEANRIAAERFQIWLSGRRVRFADLIARLTANPGHDPKFWDELLRNNQAGFYPGLGIQLRDRGNLTDRQAGYVAKFVFGRINRKNEQAWSELMDALAEEFTY